MFLIIGYIALGIFWHYNQASYAWPSLPVIAFFGGWAVLIFSLLLSRLRNRPAAGGGNLELATDDVGVVSQAVLILGVTGATVITHFI